MAATWAGVACFGTAGASPQKPRALMMSARACGFSSPFGAGGLHFAGCAPCTSAEANWKVAATAGFARGNGTGSADLAGAAEAITLTGTVLTSVAAALAPSSSSSLDLPLNRLPHKLWFLAGGGAVAVAA